MQNEWIACSKANVECSGSIDDKEELDNIVFGGAHEITIYIDEPVQFHTHTTYGEGNLVDKMSPPSGADYLSLIQSHVIEYVVAEKGIWIIEKIKPVPSELKVAVDVYFQMLKYRFVNGDYGEEDEKELASRYSLMVNEMSPKALFDEVDEDYMKYMDDQLDRTYRCGCSVSDLSKFAQRLEDERYYSIKYISL
uniref:Uncharacterized protein n=1 Tax=Pithovirus LCPAC404 TaxID=2506597 RepID=A0A481ZD02_9VIRU|nr:MAG: hypothetical protein LCPAC404_00590 [Pithovirus LCPAC404]